LLITQCLYSAAYESDDGYTLFFLIGLPKT